MLGESSYQPKTRKDAAQGGRAIASFRKSITGVGLCLMLAGGWATAPQPGSIQDVLQGRFNGAGVGPELVRYALTYADLNDDGVNEALAYVSGEDWCGTGGCRLAVLKTNGKSWSVVTITTVTQLPVRVLETRTHGWRDLAVYVSGGGIAPGEALLPFDGKSYAENPTAPPARRLQGAPPGKVVLSRTTPDKLVFPHGYPGP